jgi:hypothetical protein
MGEPGADVCVVWALAAKGSGTVDGTVTEMAFSAYRKTSLFTEYFTG